MNQSINQAPQILIQNIGDAELSYHLDEGDGPPLIFLHPTLFLPGLCHPLAQELSVDYRIIAPSFYDHREAAQE